VKTMSNFHNASVERAIAIKPALMPPLQALNMTAQRNSDTGAAASRTISTQ
jgi:hypothetical protein